MRAVNLLPREEQRPRLQGIRTPVLVLAGGLAAATAALLVLTHTTSATNDARRTELAAVEAAIDRLPDAPAPAVSQSDLAAERASRVAAFTAALGTRVPFDRLMQELSYVLPDDAWLIGITATSPTGAAADEGTTAPTETAGEVTIQGATYSHEAVARVLARLSVIPTLRDVRLGASALVEAPSSGEGASTGRRVVTFTVIASVRGAA